MVTWLVPHLSKLAVRVRFGVPGDSVAVLRALLQKLAKLFSLSTATYAPRDEAPLDGRTISADEQPAEKAAQMAQQRRTPS